MRNYLVLLCAMNLGTTGLAQDCDCPDCATCATSNWICVPQATTQSVEVTQWGVQCDLICPPRCSCCLLGNCQTPSDASCDNCCDGPETGWLGFSPRPRKRLMRKTLVYDISSVHLVAQPTWNPNSCDCDSGCAAYVGQAETIQLSDSPEAAIAMRLANEGNSGTIRWLNVADAPLTMLLPSARMNLAPITAAADDPVAVSASGALWIGDQDIEPATPLGRMTSSSKFQQPAPVLPAVTAELDLPTSDRVQR